MYCNLVRNHWTIRGRVMIGEPVSSYTFRQYIADLSTDKFDMKITFSSSRTIITLCLANVFVVGRASWILKLWLDSSYKYYQFHKTTWFIILQCYINTSCIFFSYVVAKNSAINILGNIPGRALWHIDKKASFVLKNNVYLSHRSYWIGVTTVKLCSSRSSDFTLRSIWK